MENWEENFKVLSHKYEVLKQKYAKEVNAHIKLQKEFDQYILESDKWSIEDFLEYEMDDSEGIWSITTEQAQDALETMIRQRDASIGINWDVVRVYYEDFGTFTPHDDENK